MEDAEGVDRAARHLVETFGANALAVAERRARTVNEMCGSLATANTWEAIAKKVRDMQWRDVHARRPKRLRYGGHSSGR